MAKKGVAFMIRTNGKGLAINQGGHIETDSGKMKVLTIQAIKEIKPNLFEIIGWGDPLENKPKRGNDKMKMREFLLNKGFKPETLALLDRNNFEKLALEQGFKKEVANK
jgi:hypothetical protein